MGVKEKIIEPIKKKNSSLPKVVLGLVLAAIPFACLFGIAIVMGFVVVTFPAMVASIALNLPTLIILMVTFTVSSLMLLYGYMALFEKIMEKMPEI